jgi:SAM-dependent methyltransferase
LGDKNLMQEKDAKKFTLAYLSKLGLDAARDNRSFWNNISDKYGKQVFNELNNAMTVSDAGEERNLYCIKNRSLKLSMDFSRYSADLYRRFFEWFLKNISYEPKSILDLGCDNGIVTCFFALLYPNSNVIGIDPCENGITCAEQLCIKLGLKNVEFKVARIQDISQIFSDQSFNMITSIRTLHEVTGFSDSPEHIWSLETLEKLNLNDFDNKDLVKALEDIKDRLTSDGMFISWERLPSIESCFLYIHDLIKFGLFLNSELSTKIKFHEIGDEQTMPVIVAETKGNQENLVEKVLKIYSDEVTKPFKANDTFEDAAAELRFYLCNDKIFLYGYQIDYVNENGNKARVEFWKHNSLILYYFYSNLGYRLLAIYNEADYNELLKIAGQRKNEIIQAGNIINEYDNLAERDNL